MMTLKEELEFWQSALRGVEQHIETERQGAMLDGGKESGTINTARIDRLEAQAKAYKTKIAELKKARLKEVDAEIQSCYAFGKYSIEQGGPYLTALYKEKAELEENG